MAKVASAVLILRQGNADNWNSTIDGRLQEWAGKYIDWLTTDSIALEEKAATK